METLSGELDFAGVPAALQKLDRALGQGGDALTVDLSGVTRADSAGLALLLEVTRRARARKRALSFTGTPAQVRKLAEFFGIAALLPLAG